MILRDDKHLKGTKRVNNDVNLYDEHDNIVRKNGLVPLMMSMMIFLNDANEVP